MPDYKEVLKDLREKRKKLDIAIAAIEDIALERSDESAAPARRTAVSVPEKKDWYANLLQNAPKRRCYEVPQPCW